MSDFKKDSIGDFLIGIFILFILLVLLLWSFGFLGCEDRPLNDSVDERIIVRS